MNEHPPRNLGLDPVRVTEEAALKASRWKGLGEADKANQDAIAAVHSALNSLDMGGRIIIGKEGRLGTHSPLDTNQRVGRVRPQDGCHRRSHRWQRPARSGPSRCRRRGVRRTTRLDLGTNSGCLHGQKRGKPAGRRHPGPRMPGCPGCLGAGPGGARQRQGCARPDRPCTQSTAPPGSDPGNTRGRCPHGPAQRRRCCRRPDSGLSHIGMDILTGIGGVPEGALRPVQPEPWEGACWDGSLPSLPRSEKPSRPLSWIHSRTSHVASWLPASRFSSQPMASPMAPHYHGNEAETESLIIRGETGTRRFIRSEHRIG